MQAFQVFVVGIVAGVVLLAAAVVAPRFLRTNLDEREASRQAEGARRTVARFDPGLAIAAARTEQPGITSAEQQNEAHLSEAMDAASAALRTARPIGVADVLATVALTEGTKQYALAQLARNRQRAAEAAVLAAVVEVSELRGEQQRFATVDAASALDTLADTRTQLEAQRADTAQRMAELDAALEERATRLADLTARLDQRRKELLELEQEGFVLGDDGSFQRYADRFRSLSDDLVELQREEQLLRNGGRRAAELDPYDLVASELGDGEPVPGVEELTFRRDEARAALERIDNALAATRQLAAETDSMATTARTQVQTLTELIDRSRQTLQTELTRLREASAEAGVAEQAAIEAISSAVSAFDSAASAAEQFVRAARDKQRELDPQGFNQRLKRITSDAGFVERVATARAQANTLLGHVQVDKAERLARFRDVLGQVSAIITDVDPASVEEEIAQAHTAATEALTAAIEALKPLAEAGQATSWVYGGALATAHALLADVDPANAAHRQQALEVLDNALANIENSPYARDLVRYRNHLRTAAR